MVENSIKTIDWSAAWLADWRQTGEPLAELVVAGGLSCAGALNRADDAPLRFVSQSELPAGDAYEAYIHRTGQCPTRDGLHDFFNGLCWLQFPQTKRRLNQLHVAQIAHTGIQPVRGPARDALTVFDENAAFLQAPDALWDALAAKDWARRLRHLAPAVAAGATGAVWSRVAGEAGSTEKIDHSPCLPAHPASDSIADLDAWMAADLSAEKLATKPFAHLPVLGVPGWWPGNAEPAFYADASVFRPPK